MNRTHVQSSNIASIGYDTASQILEIEFNDGSVYQYRGVDQTVYHDLMSVSSHGRYFHAYIKDAFPYSRV